MGLLSAGFLTPQYDITFSTSAEGYKRRRKDGCYSDFAQLESNASEQVLFFGGKDYLPLFNALTEAIGSRRTVFYNSRKTPDAADCQLVRYETTMRTNWHYACAQDFVAGKVLASRSGP